MTILVGIVIIILFFASAELLLPYLNQNDKEQQPQTAGFHVGVSFGGNTTAQAKLLIDRVKNFTNLFVLQSGPVSTNETSLNEIVNYAVASRLDVIVYFGYFNPAYSWQIPWLDYAKQTWGSHFLGIYLNDEPGGQTLDVNWTGFFNQIKIRDASIYLQHVPGIDLLLNGSLPIENDQAALPFSNSDRIGFGTQRVRNSSNQLVHIGLCPLLV